MENIQAQVQEAGRQAEARARHRDPPPESSVLPAIAKALDPNSDFPEKPLDSPEQQDAIRANLGPVGTGQAMKTGDQMAVRPPVAGQRGEQDLKGDMVEGINRGVGAFVGSAGDTESGKKGTGGVDFSNSAGMP